MAKVERRINKMNDSTQVIVERRKTKERLPRGIRRRGTSLVVSFALADGTIERRSLGPVGIQYAKEQREIFRRQVRENSYQRRQPRVQETFYTVGDLWSPYLRNYRNRGGKDEGRLEIAWAHLKPTFETKHVEAVTTDSVEQYIASRRADGVKAGTINRETATLRAMFQHGAKITPPMVDRLPAFPTRLKEPKPRQGFITDEQYAALAQNAKQLWLRALIACAYSFGFREGELLNLRVRQVDLLDRWIELEIDTTKNGEPRKVRMTAEVYELMRGTVRGKSETDFVFTREDGGRVVDPRDDWYTLCVASGLGGYVLAKRQNGEKYKRYVGLNLHDFRRSAIRNMTRRNVPEVVAMKISGHKTRSVFMRYNIVDEADLIRASERIEEGRQRSVPAVKSDTKTDTSSYAPS
jgi:integrase